MQTSHETLWHATTEDETPVEFFLVDDSPEGVSFIVSEGEREIGVTLSDVDIQSVIATLVAWRAGQARRLIITDVDADDSHGQ